MNHQNGILIEQIFKAIFQDNQLTLAGQGHILRKMKFFLSRYFNLTL